MNNNQDNEKYYIQKPVSYIDTEKNTHDINEITESINTEINKKHLTKKKKKKSNIIFKIAFIFLLIIIIFSISKIFYWLIDNKKTSNYMDDVNDTININEIEDNSNTSLISEEEDKDSPYWYYIKFPLIDVDISKLKRENSDIVGWLNVNNTNVNYPFVQTNNNNYYLNHSIDKTYNEAGWLFLDYRNDSSLNNKNSIIYAHSRLDKSMFGSLSKVLKQSWYDNKDNHIIRISLENENTLWQIFSVYKIKTENYYITTFFDTEEEYMTFLNTLSERSLYNFNTKLYKEDKILTLSTCYSDTERTVVHAKLIKKQIK